MKEEVEDWPAGRGGSFAQGATDLPPGYPGPPRRVRDHRVHGLRQHRDVLDELLEADGTAVLERLSEPGDPRGWRIVRTSIC
ncbi:hypothetical protein [Streptomyces albipurpureus]|uniref:Uncharacterized protein n=1 Tax=Streptomyces albipurpureus TaxID=2897419 RepID=A0ABT0UH02_9ACTN|nr:hypothetical protein [Streptomyces sp. CWNU-1]MCM2386905.1 hypothetical protein [Streptomyces sp. CWNU-1]